MREVGNEYIGKSVACPKCKTVIPIHNTLTFIQALIKKHLEQRNELQRLKQASSTEQNMPESFSLEEVDVHNTDVLTQAGNIDPILQWFEKHNINANVHPEAMDTTGFFDEIALLLGNNYDVLSFVSSQIKYVQNKGYETVKLDLSNKNSQESEQIASFCKQLYEYAFIARCAHKKKENIIYLNLHNVPKIKEFFNGIWLEWFVFIKLLELCQEQKITLACARSVKITFNENESNEIDLFCLTEKNIPIYVECKSGEFRQDLTKLLSLRKKLGMDRKHFIICVLGLTQQQMQGMTAMYDLTFVNEASFTEHVKTLLD
jgi:hypothetical protein